MSHCSPRRREDRGFTLLEIMMAMTIVAIIATLVWASFGRLLHASSDIQRRDEFWHGVRLAMNRMAREVGAAFVSDNYDPNRYSKDDPEDRPTFFVIEDGGEHDALHFTAFVARRLYRDEKVSDQAIVSYTLDRDDEGRTHLYRRQKNIIDEDWDRGGERAILLEDVEAFDVQWWDPDDEDWESSWDTRDRDQHDRLPSRVRIRVRVKEPDGREQTFEVQTRIMLTTPLRW